MRARLEDLGLGAFAKTTGGKGLHIVVPVVRKQSWGPVKEFCQEFAQTFVREAPELYTSNMSKAKRQGKIFIDYLRNSRGATAVAAYFHARLVWSSGFDPDRLERAARRSLGSVYPKKSSAPAGGAAPRSLERIR